MTGYERTIALLLTSSRRHLLGADLMQVISRKCGVGRYTARDLPGVNHG